MKKNTFLFSVVVLMFCIECLFLPAVYAFAIPKPPAALAATNITHNQATLTWTDASTDETGFELERSLNGTAFTKLTDLAANITTYTSINLTPSTRYWYRIRAKNASGFSAYSNVLTVTTKAAPVTIPKAPSNLVATVVSAYQINLAWINNATDETGFELERSVDGLRFVKVADVAKGAVAYQNTGLLPATRYWYRILAKNTAGKSPYSNIASAITLQIPPAAPGQLTAVSISTSQINLTWQDMSDNETGFQIERAADGVTFAKIADVGPNVETYQDTGLIFNTAYYYRVRATNAIGSSAYSNTSSARTQNIPVPSAPQNFTAVPTGPDLIQLRWDRVPGNVTGMVVERSKGSEGQYVELARLAATAQQYQDAGKFENLNYYYRVKAVNGGGDSPYSLVSIVRAESIITASPVSEYIIRMSGRTLITELPTELAATLTIYNTAGHIKDNRSLAPRAYTDLIHLPAGIYIAVLETADEVISRKILLY